MGLGITARNWKPAKTRGSLLGFFDLVLPLPGGGTLAVQSCKYMSGSRGEWVALPEREYQKRDGSKGYAAIVWVEDKATSEAFKAEALRAIQALAAGTKSANGETYPHASPTADWGGGW